MRARARCVVLLDVPPRSLEMRFADSAAWLTAALVACGLTLGPLARVQAAETFGSTSRVIHQEAVRALPLDKLDAQARAKIALVISDADIFRRLPAQVIDCNPDLFLFLIHNPEVIVNVWELMGVSKVTMQRIGPNTFDASDHAGSRCKIEFLYSDHDLLLIYAEGSYDGPLFARPLRAKCVLTLRSAAIRETDGRDYITCRMDTFIHIENVGVELLAKTFQPLVTKSADYNFQETAAFVSMMSKTAEKNPQGIGRLAAKLQATEPEIRNQFAVMAQNTADHANQRRVEHEAAKKSRPALQTSTQRR